MACTGKRKVHGYNVLVRKPQGKKPLGIRTRGWENNKQILKILKDWRAWSILIWLRMGTNGGLL